jgi:hypothetical protein
MIYSGDEREVMETYQYYPPKARATRVPYNVLNEGDPDCEHKRDSYEVVAHEGVVFARFKCVNCGRVIAHNVGEVIAPDSWGQS